MTAAPGFSGRFPVQRRTFFARGVMAFLLVAATTSCQVAQARSPASQGSSQTGDSVVVLAAGDLVCGTQTPAVIPCLHVRVADLVRQLKPDALLLLGDLQYETGSPQDFSAYFDPAFGEFKSITYPVPGNHEYFTRGAAGYFDYFNGTGVDSGRAGSRRRGYYSFDLGSWHIVALNSNCADAGGCGARSAQAQWLRNDLAANPRVCTLAFMHSARFSSGEHGNDELMRDLWQILFDGGADLVLAGHDHSYERFGPQDATGRRNEDRGLRSFVVGTGGKGLGRIVRARPNSEVRDVTSIGLLRLTLRPTDYSWRFVAVPGLPLNDSGTASCEPPGQGSGKG